MKVLVFITLISFTFGFPKSNSDRHRIKTGVHEEVPGCGVEAEYGEFPHVARLTYSAGAFICAGSLINPRWILTVGHCCATYRLEKVVLGSLSINEALPEQQVIQVERMVLHESYDDWTVQNDICLLQLQTPANITDNVAPIQLPDENQDYEDGMECTEAGWFDGPHLKKVDLPVWSDQHCSESYGDEIADSMICAGYTEGGCGVCQSNSGDPLMCADQLAGLSSWGYGCADPRYPSVYTQTTYFLDWVNSHIN